jgi:uncharacterized protein DUF932
MTTTPIESQSRFTPVWEFGQTNIEGLTAMEAMDQAGLSNWNVRTESIEYADLNTMDYRMIVRDDRRVDAGRRLVSDQLVKPAYIPIQNEEVFIGIIEMLAGSGLTTSSAGTLGKMDNRAFITFNAGDIHLPGNEHYKKYIFAVAGHDGRTAVYLTPTGVRVICINTERAALEEGHSSRTLIKIQHNQKAIDAFYANTDSVRDVLRLSHHYQNQLTEIAAGLQSVPFGVKQYELAVKKWADNGLNASEPPITERKRHIWDNRANALEEAWELETVRAEKLGQTDTTLWTARQAVSTWTQHSSGSERRSASRSMALALGDNVGMYDSMLRQIKNVAYNTSPNTPYEKLELILA